MLDLAMLDRTEPHAIRCRTAKRPPPRQRTIERSAARRALCAAAVLVGAMAATPMSRAGQTVDYPDHGVRFTVPAGWTGREIDGGLLLGSTTVPGLLLVLPHEHRDLAALRAEAAAGLGNGPATSLRLHGSLEDVGIAAVGGEFRGRFDGEPATAFAVGLINSHGVGLTVMAVTQPDEFTPQHRSIALALAHSIAFYPPRPPALLQKWRDALTNRRLARYHSTYSSGSGGYSGFQSSTQLHLCAAGHFAQGSRESGSFDAPGAFGSTRGGAVAHGRWQVIAHPDGSPWLQLTYRNGSEENYQLEMRGSSTYLNGARYFRAASERCQ
jgi:hypothetical protein